MAYQTHHCSAAFRCSVPHCLSAHLTCTICSSAFYALCAMSIHCTNPLLFNSVAALSSFFTYESPSTTTTTTNSNSNNTLLFFVSCIYSFCASCACNIRHSSACSYCTNILHLSSALLDHQRDSSASLVVHPMCLSSLGVKLRFLFLSGS
jgi:hypothetical protein